MIIEDIRKKGEMVGIDCDQSSRKRNYKNFMNLKYAV